MDRNMRSVIADVRDMDTLQRAFSEARPEIVLHLAAQPIVREGYRIPRHTYETNVMGTVNVLECVRLSTSACSTLIVTTDKVYENLECTRGYQETDRLDGYDPYSNSKSCAELVTSCYARAYFSESTDVCKTVSTARAGNVIGGGDFAQDRIVPDCVRAALQKETITVRNPYSIRPYQHVLDPLFVYLMIAQKQYEDNSFSGCYNVGPNDGDCVTTGTLATLFCDAWGEGMRWENGFSGGPHEAAFLKLDCAKLKSAMNWQPRWHIDVAMKKTVEWVKAYRDGADIAACMQAQIQEFNKG